VFSLVVGADIEPELSSWYGAEELVRTVPRIAIGRGGFAGGGGLVMPAVSSTEVRSRLAQGESVAGLLPRAVDEYIRQHRLYPP
jgi:nicotinate-nucleotide adenylyltransferase